MKPSNNKLLTFEAQLLGDPNKKTLAEFVRGKKAILIVNVASNSGKTKVNYEQLVDLYTDNSAKGL